MFLACMFRRIVLAVSVAAVLSLCGCTSFHDYIHNGFKVGPNYCPPPAPVAKHWIDDVDVQATPGQDISCWWALFHDPTLDRLVVCAYRQNLTLREAAFRILQARATLGIARGEIFPQTQNATGSYQRIARSQNTAVTPIGSPLVPFYDQWTFGFNLAWEIDFWGRLRRAIASADAQLGASVADYDQVLVTLLGDVASNYVQIRTDQERLRYLRQNVTILELVLKWTQRREKVGFRATLLDVHQTESNLEQTISGISLLEIDLRMAENRLCTLLGMPPMDVRNMIGEDVIPKGPPQLAIGIPADLLRRRPDVPGPNAWRHARRNLHLLDIGPRCAAIHRESRRHGPGTIVFEPLRSPVLRCSCPDPRSRRNGSPYLPRHHRHRHDRLRRRSLPGTGFYCVAYPGLDPLARSGSPSSASPLSPPASALASACPKSGIGTSPVGGPRPYVRYLGHHASHPAHSRLLPHPALLATPTVVEPVHRHRPMGRAVGAREASQNRSPRIVPNA